MHVRNSDLGRAALCRAADRRKVLPLEVYDMHATQYLCFVLTLTALNCGLVFSTYGQTDSVPATTAGEANGAPAATESADAVDPTPLLSPTASGEPTVVAIVNGSEVSIDAGLHRSSGGPDSPRKQYLIQQAIDVGLLYQAAVATGLNKSAEFEEMVDSIEYRARMAPIERLSSYYQQQVMRSGDLPVEKVSDTEVEAIFEKGKHKRGELSEERAKELIRGHREHKARQAASANWTAGLAKSIPVNIDDETVSPEIVAAAVQTVRSENPPEQEGALWQELIRIAAAKGIKTGDRTELHRALSGMTMQVGHYSVPLAGPNLTLLLPQQQSPDSRDTALIPLRYTETAIAGMMTTYITAGAAKAAGIEKVPEGYRLYPGDRPRNAFEDLTENKIKRTLGRLFVQKQTGTPKLEDFTQQEIDDYFAANEKRFEGLLADHGRDKVDDEIRYLLLEQAMREARKRILDSLKANAEIQMVEAGQ